MMVAGSFAGVLVHRWDRRRVLILCDVGQAFGTLLLLASLTSGGFQLCHLYMVAAFQGLLGMLQRPALEATVTLLVPPGHLDRANVLQQVSGQAAGIIAPALAGALYPLVGVTGVMAVDLATFAAAVAVVARVPIPRHGARAPEGARASLWADYREGLRFLRRRPTLLFLMLYAALLNFLLAGPIGLTTPYVLTLTRSEAALGLLLAVMNTGIVAGGVVMSVWGGTRPRIHGIMLALLFRAAWLALYGMARTPLSLGLALFFVFFTNPLVDASFASLLQLKVPPALVMGGLGAEALLGLRPLSSPYHHSLTSSSYQAPPALQRAVACREGPRRPGAGATARVVRAGQGRSGAGRYAPRIACSV